MPEIGFDRSSLKIGALGVVGVFLAGLFSYQFFRLGADANLGAILIVIGLVAAWLIVVGLRVFLIKTLNIAALIAFLETLAVWLMMPQKLAAINLLGAVLLFASLFTGFLGGRASLNNILKIKFWLISRRVIPTAMNGLTLLITLYMLGSFNFTQFAIPRGAFDFFLKGSEPILAGLIPNFSLEAKVNDVLRSFVESRLPPGAPASAINEAVSGLKRSIKEATGIAISGDEKVGDALYDISMARLANLSSALKNISLVAAGLIIFLSIKGLAFFLNWFIIILAFLIFKMLLALNFMRISGESQNKEIIVIN